MRNGDPYGGRPPYQAERPTSENAAASMVGTARAKKRKVLEYISSRRRFGATDQEIQSALNMTVSTEVPRRRELVLDGLVKDSGKVRKTRSGRGAVVWVAVNLPAVDDTVFKNKQTAFGFK